MLKSKFVKSLLAVIGVSSTLLVQSCGKKSVGLEGQLVGEPDREGWTMSVPYGMVVAPSGTFHMGQADQDVPATYVNMNKQITIGGFYMDDTEITNNEYRQFMNAMLQDSSQLGIDYLMTELYPDTMVWMKDFSHHYGDPMMEYYYAHPAFDDYPVVGVDWGASQKFCEWRSNYLNDWRVNQMGLFRMPNYRLPSG